MSKKTNAGKKPIQKDYGVQSYRACDKGYTEAVGTPSFKAAHDAVVIKESEFAKPYGTIFDDPEDYSAMEYAAPNLPDYPGMDFPGMGLPIPDFEDLYTPWNLIFHCTCTDCCYCADDKRCFTISCTHEVIGVTLTWPEGGWAMGPAGGSQVCITAPGDASGSVEIDVHMRAVRPWKSPHGTSKYVYGTHYSIHIDECKEEECESCPPDENMAWDDNSDETIARPNGGGETANIAIIGENTPFAWSVAEEGYWFDYESTDGLSNVLNANSNACGSATITVTGCDDNVVTGHVRCVDASSWVLQDWNCAIPGPWTSHTAVRFERIYGQYKIHQDIGPWQGCQREETCFGVDCSAFGDTEWCVDWLCGEVSPVYGDCGQKNFCCQTGGQSCATTGWCICFRNVQKLLYKWECDA